MIGYQRLLERPIRFGEDEEKAGGVREDEEGRGTLRTRKWVQDEDRRTKAEQDKENSMGRLVF